MNVVIEKQNILWRLFGHCFKWALFSKKFLAKQSKSLMTLTLSLLSDDNKGLQRRWQCSTSSQWSFPFVILMQIIYWSRRGSFTKWYYIPHRVQGTKHLLKEKKKKSSRFQWPTLLRLQTEIINKQTTHSFSSVNTAETPHLHDVHQVKEARFEECKTDATYHT